MIAHWYAHVMVCNDYALSPTWTHPDPYTYLWMQPAGLDLLNGLNTDSTLVHSEREMCNNYKAVPYDSPYFNTQTTIKFGLTLTVKNCYPSNVYYK